MITPLTENPRRAAEHRVVTAVGLVVSSAVIVYVVANGMRGNNQTSTATPKVVSSAASPNASPFAPRVFPLTEPINPPPSEGTRISLLATPSPVPSKANAVDRSDHRTVRRRPVPRRQPFIAKARAFLRKLF